MKNLFFIIILLPSFLFAQRKLEKEKEQILAEGMALYTLILANWTSNDLYYENEYSTAIVKGYLSYKEKDSIKTIFWRKIDTSSAEYKAKTFQEIEGDSLDAGMKAKPKELGDLRVIVKTIVYPRMVVKRSNASIEEEEREPTKKEIVLMDFRETAYKMVDEDTVFYKRYAGINLRAALIETGKEMRVYFYPSTTREGVIPFGSDYLLVFSTKDKKLLSKTDLHHDCILLSSRYKGKKYDASKATQHAHAKEADDFITPTDVALLLLYKNQLEWDEHHVVGGKYTSIFTLVDRKLDIMLTEDFNALKKKKLDVLEEEKKGKMH